MGSARRVWLRRVAVSGSACVEGDVDLGRPMQDLMGYSALLERAMRLVARQALQKVVADGLPGAHHFYIAFRTDHEGVSIPDSLRQQYPHHLTIVLQHQYWNLECDEDAFEVDLNFSRRMERVRIPFDALVSFTDPSVNFTLTFQAGDGEKPVDAPAAGRPYLRAVEPDEATRVEARKKSPRPTPARTPIPPTEMKPTGNVLVFGATHKGNQMPPPDDGDAG